MLVHGAVSMSSIVSILKFYQLLPSSFLFSSVKRPKEVKL